MGIVWEDQNRGKKCITEEIKELRDWSKIEFPEGHPFKFDNSEYKQFYIHKSAALDGEGTLDESLEIQEI